MSKFNYEDDNCDVCLSADGKWLRIIFEGKLILAFHVSYVSKVISGEIDRSVSIDFKSKEKAK